MPCAGVIYYTDRTRGTRNECARRTACLCSRGHRERPPQLLACEGLLRAAADRKAPREGYINCRYSRCCAGYCYICLALSCAPSFRPESLGNRSAFALQTIFHESLHLLDLSPRHYGLDRPPSPWKPVSIPSQHANQLARPAAGLLASHGRPDTIRLERALLRHGTKRCGDAVQ